MGIHLPEKIWRKLRGQEEEDIHYETMGKGVYCGNAKKWAQKRYFRARKL
jgi:hypothetical protein